MMPDPSQPKKYGRGARKGYPTVIRNIGQVVTVAQHPIPGATGPLQVISDAAPAIEHGSIVWIGRDDDAEPMFQRHTGAHPGG